MAPFLRTWVLPLLGCGTAGVAVIGRLLSTASLEPPQTPLQLARTNPQLISMLGEPIYAERVVFDDGLAAITRPSDAGPLDGGTQLASYRVAIWGPKGRGDLYVRLRKNDRSWALAGIQFLPDETSGSAITLQAP